MFSWLGDHVDHCDFGLEPVLTHATKRSLDWVYPGLHRHRHCSPRGLENQHIQGPWWVGLVLGKTGKEARDFFFGFIFSSPLPFLFFFSFLNQYSGRYLPFIPPDYLCVLLSLLLEETDSWPTSAAFAFWLGLVCPWQEMGGKEESDVGIFLPFL